jgi:hypothetical protein
MQQQKVVLQYVLITISEMIIWEDVLLWVDVQMDIMQIILQDTVFNIVTVAFILTEIIRQCHAFLIALMVYMEIIQTPIKNYVL